MGDLFAYLPIFTMTRASAPLLQRFYACVVPRLVSRGLLVASIRQLPEEDSALPLCCLVASATASCGSLHYGWRGKREHLALALRRLAREADLLFVEEELEPGMVRLSLAREETIDADVLALHNFERHPEEAASLIVERLGRQLQARPVWACILIGGRSSRMGRPKHLLPAADSSSCWLERAVQTILPLVAGVVLSGHGEVPNSLAHLARLPDIPGVEGPLTGILAAMRWQPDVSWLLLACDLPALSEEAVSWLLSQQQPGRWGVVPRISPERALEPLFARYEPQCASRFEQLAEQGIRRIGRIAEADRVDIVQVPERLHASWQNINTPEELDSFRLASPLPL